MNTKPTSLIRSENISQLVLIILGSLFILIYLLIALMRLSYPFELEWMEGGSVLHVQRILDGRSLYVSPSLDFIPFIYTPLYFYVSSIFAQLIGNGFLALRLVSFLASLGCFAFIYMIVHRRTSSLYAAILATSLFAATFRISGAWFDIARVDSLFLFFLLAGLFAFESPRMATRSFIAPVLLFLSFFTKQSALIVAGCLSIAALYTRKRSEGFWFPLIFSLLMIVSFLIMNSMTDGWFRHYIFDLPREHEIVNSIFIRFWTFDILQYMAIALCICAIPFLNLGTEADSRSKRAVQDILILGGLFLTSYFSRLHSGGYDNVLMPVYAGIAIYFGIGFAAAHKAIDKVGNVKILLILATAFQFVILLYPYKLQVPTAMDKEQGEKLLELVSTFEGEVYLSDHPWYLGVLNKTAQAQDMAVRDVTRGSESLDQELNREMANAIAEKKYEAFIVDFEDFALRVPDFETHYELVESNLSDGNFHPVTGWDRRPTYLYIRKAVD